MKVILLQELKGKGGEGDVIDVADGFANNYLLTEGVAIKATKGNLKQLEQRRHNIAKREETRFSNADQMKQVLEGKVVKVAAQVGEEGQLFGSVTTQMIADACKEQTDVDIDKRRIELGKPIKTAGEHEVVISLYRDIKAVIKVYVGSAEELTATPETETVVPEIEGAVGMEIETTPEVEATVEVVSENDVATGIETETVPEIEVATEAAAEVVSEIAVVEHGDEVEIPVEHESEATEPEAK